MKLLIVEDDHDLRESLVGIFEGEGYEVEAYGDGDEGSYRAENWDYDAILLDVMMPGMGGFEVLSRLRQEKQTPVLMLTARDGIEDRVKGLDLGADDYIVKPFIRDELLARVRALIRRGGVKSERQICCGDLMIDTTKQLVTYKGTLEELSTREFKLLELLIRKRGEVVTREYIFDYLFYEEGDEALSNMLDVYIYKLRRKFGKDLIKTKRGAGYIVH